MKDVWIEEGLKVMKAAVDKYPKECLSNTVGVIFKPHLLVVWNYVECEITGRRYKKQDQA